MSHEKKLKCQNTKKNEERHAGESVSAIANVKIVQSGNVRCKNQHNVAKAFWKTWE